MNTEYFTEMHKLIERAKNYEKTGREQEALVTYLEIHEKFFPNTSDLYERPAILLEKRKRFDEAIHICEKAIKLIDEGKITGIKDNFVRRIDRIKARPDYIAEHGQPAEKKVKNPFSLSWGKKTKKEMHKTEPKGAKTHLENENAAPASSTVTASAVITGTSSLADSSATAASSVTAASSSSAHTAASSASTPAQVVSHKDGSNNPSEKYTQKQETHKVFDEENQGNFMKAQLDNKANIDVDVSLENTQDHGRHKPSEIKGGPKGGLLHRIETAFTHAKNSFMHMKKPSKKTVIFSSILLALICSIFYGLAKNDRSKFEVFIDVSEFESTGAPIGNPFPTDLSDLPPITGSMIDTAVKSVSQMNGVSTAGVIVQKNVTGFVIMLEPGTSRSDAKNAAENFVKALGAAAASENRDLSGPNMVSYGSLYDYYGALVVAGVSPEDLTIKGVKVPKALGFTWK